MGIGAGHGLHMGAGGALLGYPAGSGLMGGAAAGSTGTAKGMTAALGPNPATAATTGASKVAAAGVTAGSKGFGYGLSVGLGFWGPALLAGIGAAGAYALWKSYRSTRPPTEDEAELSEALNSRR
ncbi:MAG: hypothetical protein WCF85_00545 [Rhodospirillaceae bacterium]